MSDVRIGEEVMLDRMVYDLGLLPPRANVWGYKVWCSESGTIEVAEISPQDVWINPRTPQ